VSNTRLNDFDISCRWERRRKNKRKEVVRVEAEKN
jgi:hypothetical protein